MLSILEVGKYALQSVLKYIWNLVSKSQNRIREITKHLHYVQIEFNHLENDNHQE